jgi:NAD(P)-dependent dehydrogenase (short-subunit alcohol dehydrogenase family)
MARIAIITGAASGIGRALAGALAARGDAVVLADIDGAGADRAARELAREGPGPADPAHRARAGVLPAPAAPLLPRGPTRAGHRARARPQLPPLVIAPRSARVAWQLWRYAPVVVNQMTQRQLAWARTAFATQPAEADPGPDPRPHTGPDPLPPLVDLH